MEADGRRVPSIPFRNWLKIVVGTQLCSFAMWIGEAGSQTAVRYLESMLGTASTSEW